MIVLAAFVTLSIRAWELFQPAPQKIRSTATCVSTGPPLSRTALDPALLQITVGTARSSRYSRKGCRRALCGWRCRGREDRIRCQHSAKSMVLGLLRHADL